MTTRVLELFIELARIPSPPGDERRVADRVCAQLAQLEIACCEDDTARALGGNTGNLIASLPANVDCAPALLFCAHLDTVPERGTIVPIVDDGVVRSKSETILGADNKAAVAAMLEAVRLVITEGRPHGDIHLVFTPMEEIGCRGAAALDLAALRTALGFVYDYSAPIGVYVASGPSGFLLEIEFVGRSAHAGIAPEDGRSAVLAAASAISLLPAGRLEDGTTVNVGLIGGGTAHNVVPERCAITVDVRSPGRPEAEHIVDEILTTCTTVAARHDCLINSEQTEKYAAYELEPDAPVVTLARHALERLSIKMTPVPATGGADASVFNARGLPCLNLANGMAEIHTTDEQISVADLELMVEVTLAIIAEAASASDP